MSGESELMEELVKLRASFEVDKKQVVDLLTQANALLDHALDPATPRSEMLRDGAMAEALMERFRMVCTGQQPS